MTDGRRLIEDLLPIAKINDLSQREKVGRPGGHPAKLHLWWARRPLAAARAALYAALVPADERSDEDVAGFVEQLCQWDAPARALGLARSEILAAHGGTPPAVLDLFAGGGAIPLEAARLGCEATAVELNPVAHLVERCTLEYPQRLPGLGNDVRRWGRMWVDWAEKRLADLYPPIVASAPGTGQGDLFGAERRERRPLAYLWTRTVRCPNPAVPEHRAPLVRQTWLARKPGRYVALRTVVDRAALEVGYEVVESATEDGLGFDPAGGSRRGQTTCPVCGAVVPVDHVKAEGMAGRLGVAPLAAVVLATSGRGREYLPPGRYPLPDDAKCERRLAKLLVQPPDEAIETGQASGIRVPPYGLTRFRDLFTPRQLVTQCTLAEGLRHVHDLMLANNQNELRAQAIATYLALALDRLADLNSTLTHWASTGHAETVNATFARQALAMVWDFGEVNPFAGGGRDLADMVETAAAIADSLSAIPPARVIRASATSLPLPDASQDAIVTDPPYYDNISYADISDFFYVWLKRSVGHLYPDDLGGRLTPKRSEAVSMAHRHGGDHTAARVFYEDAMRAAFREANRVLKPDAPLVCIYAHRTTLGWSTLVDALRGAGFTIVEAWPVDTEMAERTRGQRSAALASSIFLVARKRPEGAGVGREADVVAELDTIIAERVDRLTRAGVAGSDLVIATVGAGLKAFTRFDRVERDNGAVLETPRFLVVVQNRILDAVFGGLTGADAVTRFYLAGRFSYGSGAVPFDEINNLARMTGVELDGTGGLAGGPAPLVAKSGASVSLRDFEERGDAGGLGMRDEVSDASAPLIDVAHAVLWRAEHRDRELRDYLVSARPDAGLLRAVIQSLAGRALRAGSADGKSREAAAAERLLGSWRRLVEENLFT